MHPPYLLHADLNGKKFAWQGVALLPFVDEKRLLRTLKKVSGTLPLAHTFGQSRLGIL